MPLVLNWQNEPNAAADLSPIHELLVQGQPVAIPTESGYQLVASLQHGGPEKLASIAPNVPLYIATLAYDDLTNWYRHRPLLFDRLMPRLWPGPVSLATPIDPQDLRRLPQAIQHPQILENQSIRLVCFQHGGFLTLLSQTLPLVLVELPLKETARHPGILHEEFGDWLAGIVDAGEILSQPFTQVQIRESGIELVRNGLVPEQDIHRAAAKWFLFVCTGNTCRSPMAEALFKVRLAQRLNCTVDELLGKGYNIESAGIATYGGDAAAQDAIEVVRNFGANLESHRSQSTSEKLVESADHLIAMTRSHLTGLLGRYIPQGTLQLLCGLEGDLEDPIGGGPEIYQECASTILRHVDRLISEYHLT